MRIALTVAAGTATLLSSIGLYPLFVDARWLVPGLGAILAVSAAGLLARRYRLPAAVDLLAGLAVLFVYVTMLYAGPEALLRVVPTPASLDRLADLVGEGWDVANRYAAPVPLMPGVSLLAVLGIGLVAVVVDFLTVRLRRAAAAGLPLLAMYSVPAAIREESVSWLAFLVGAVGFMGLLLADSRERVSGWGRPVFTRRWSATPTGDRPDSTALAAAGYRVGLTAVAVAVLVPTVVPGIHPRGLFGMGGGGRGGGGSQMVTTPDPIASLKRELTQQDDTVVLTYRTDVQRPDYLRMYALDRFDGDRWTYSALQSTSRDRVEGRALPPAAGLGVAPMRPVTTRVKVERRVRDMTFLPLPYPAVRVDIKGDWRAHPQSLMVYSLRDAAGGRTYTVNSLHVEPTPEELIAAPERVPPELGPYLNIPREVPESVRELAMEKTAGAASSFEKAVKLQDWFTLSGQFTYDLNSQSPKNMSNLLDFLTASKRGYCEQFAAAMALLARTLGIPARVAMGYTAGTLTTDGSWVVRSRDAHAWPELYFEGAGWVRFEPTPSGALGQGTASTPAYTQPVAPGQTGQTGQTAPTPTESAANPLASPSATAGRRPDDINTAPGAAPQLDSTDGWGAPGWVSGLLAALLLLSIPMNIRILARRRRWAHVDDVPRTWPNPVPGRTAPGSPRGPADALSPENAIRAAGVAHAAWKQLRTDAIDHGLPWRTSESPRATARRLARHLPLGADALDSLTRIARAEERARYAPAPGPAGSLRADSRLVRAAFAHSVSARTRWRARLLPPSAIAVLRHAAGRALDGADRLTSLPMRAGRRK